ncbi:MAG: DUF1571 domain-containing protein [Gemmatales bacterium]|nr:DUF1571 domain-containing protein [Gemmatales bacterium]MDW8175288.1 DUF1571 domain-containing protein [Gemmatales bacterium]
MPWRAPGLTPVAAKLSRERNQPEAGGTWERWPDARSEPARQCRRPAWPRDTSQKHWLTCGVIVFVVSVGCHWTAWLDPQRWPRVGSLPGADEGGVGQDKTVNLSENGKYVPQGGTEPTDQVAAASSRGLGTKNQHTAQAGVSKCEVSESASPQAPRTEASRWISPNDGGTALWSHIVGNPKTVALSEPTQGSGHAPPCTPDEHVAISRMATDEDAAEANQWAKVQQLVLAAQQRYAQVHDYVCRFRRREVLAEGPVSQDMVLLRIRKEPWSVHFVWPKGNADEGREVVYVQGRFNNQLVVRTGKGDLLSGLRVQLALDSPRATAKTRRQFLEVGVGYLVDSLTQIVQEQRQGTNRFGRLRYHGRQARPESATPMECLMQEIPPHLEKYLPRGGKRYFYLATDPRVQEHQLPVLVITHDDAGREVEYYCYDRFNINIGLRDEDFDPDRLWGKR